MVGNEIRILGICGSLRGGSYNKMLLNAASELLPVGTAMEIFSLDGIPAFNQDLEGHLPEKVKELKDKIKSADAILISTPEYNYSVPGVLKNAIDWASRPYGDNAFDRKPVAVISASPGAFGGARAQYHLRQIMLCVGAFMMPKPEVFVASADRKFEADGKLSDTDTERHVRTFLESFVKWAKAIGNAAASGLL